MDFGLHWAVTTPVIWKLGLKEVGSKRKALAAL